MAKIITNEELANIITDIVYGYRDTIEGANYSDFLSELAQLIGKYCGGTPSKASSDIDGKTVAFTIDKNVPADGGIFNEYDEDVIWQNGEEEVCDRVKIIELIKTLDPSTLLSLIKLEKESEATGLVNSSINAQVEYLHYRMGFQKLKRQLEDSTSI